MEKKTERVANHLPAFIVLIDRAKEAQPDKSKGNLCIILDIVPSNVAVLVVVAVTRLESVETWWAEHMEVLSTFHTRLFAQMQLRHSVAA